MSEEMVDKIARAVLYEGYILYPYRPSTKNRQRWTFGGLYPQSWCRTPQGADASSMQAECPVLGAAARVSVNVRFLHLVQRTAGALASPMEALPADGVVDFRAVDAMEVAGKLYQSWQEAVERDVVLSETVLAALAAAGGGPRREHFAFPSGRTLEPMLDSDGKVAAVIVREQHALEGSVEVSAIPAGDGLFRLKVRVSNDTASDEETAGLTRDEASLRSLVSTHAVLHVEEGEFVSLLDPPEAYRDAVAACSNVGVWPVLVGQEGEKGTMLASPIILYDYPQVAPESPGDLFDSTEIDEILSLRILTLTDQEKREVIATDPRAAGILERTEALAREQLMGLHGTVRSMRPVASPEHANG